MKSLVVLCVAVALVGCKKGSSDALEQAATTSVSLSLNESSCNLLEKIGSASMSESQMLIISLPVAQILHEHQSASVEYAQLKELQLSRGLDQQERNRMKDAQRRHILFGDLASSYGSLAGNLLINGCEPSRTSVKD